MHGTIETIHHEVYLMTILSSSVRNTGSISWGWCPNHFPARGRVPENWFQMEFTAAWEQCWLILLWRLCSLGVRPTVTCN